MNSLTITTRYFAGVALAAVLLVGGFTVLALSAHAQDGSVAPVISNIASTTADTTATITWTTDQAGTAQVFYGPTTSYGSASTLDNSTSSMSHTSFLGGLTANTLYHFEVVTDNASGTAATSSDMTFMTTNSASTTTGTAAPVVSAVLATPTNTGATITWTTDQSANSQILYGTTNAYGSATTLDTSNVTSHSEMLTGLTPNTTYHFQVWSTGTGTTTAGTSTDMTFTTGMASTTGEPVLSAILASPTDTTATITWTTDENANSQIMYGTTNAYGNTTTLDTNSVMSHSEMITGLTPSTTYHFQVWSTDAANNVASSTDLTFTTSVSSTTGTTGSTTDETLISMLQSEVATLQSQVATLQSQVAGLLGMGGGTGSTTPPTNTSSGTLDQSNITTSAGGTLNFGGRNFPREENITITLNGTTVATVHADGGGNFSSGSLTAPTTAGTYTYVFTGSTGDVSSATVTVQ